MVLMLTVEKFFYFIKAPSVKLKDQFLGSSEICCCYKGRKHSINYFENFFKELHPI